MSNDGDVRVRLGDEVAELTGSSPAALSLLRDALDGPAEDAPPTLFLHCDPGAVPVPPGPAARQVHHLRWWDTGADAVVADVGGATARVRGSTAVLDPGPSPSGTHGLLFPVLTALLTDVRTAVVHGAGVLDAEGGVAVALGGSGTGKSTLVLAALKDGRAVLGDDLLLVRDGPQGVVAFGVPQPLALPGVGAAVPHDPRGRGRVRPGGDFPGTLTRGWHPVRRVVLVGHGTRGEVRPATSPEVLAAAVGSTLDGLEIGLVGRVFHVACALARLPGWHLAHDADEAARLTLAMRSLVWAEQGQGDG